MTKHQYYHRLRSCAKRGKKKSARMKRILEDGTKVKLPNASLELEMKVTHQNPDLRCEALRMTQHLQLKGYVVNHKKVASMMRILGLRGMNKCKSKKRDKHYAKYGMMNPTAPLTYLQMDIKSHWLVSERCQAYPLTFIDTFTHQTLVYCTGYSVKALDVKMLLEELIEKHLGPAGRAWSEIEVIITSDNGAQFIADLIKDFMERYGIKQMFTHPCTPEENGYIEGFHATMSCSVEREHFNLTALKERLKVFSKNYNTSRPHTSTKGLPPEVFKRAWENDWVMTCYVPKKVF